LGKRKKIKVSEVLPILSLEKITNHGDNLQCEYKFPTNGGFSNSNPGHAVFMSGRPLVLRIDYDE